MNGCLIDTNVISELVKAAPNGNVVEFLSTVDAAWLSIISVHELLYGLNLLAKGKRRLRLDEKLQQLLSDYRDFVIPVDHQEASEAAVLRVKAKRSGRVLHLADSLIAGTAKTHNLSVVTRNLGDFSGIDIDVINPWEG